MSMATASTAPICSGVRVAQNPSRLLCLRLQHAAPCQIVQGEIVMALAKRFLIDTELSDRRLVGAPIPASPLAP